MRSFVPTLKKSTSGASRSATTAALGTSRLTPTGTSSRKATPSARSSALTRSSSASARRRSPGPLTNGNMIRTGPCSPARSSARSCTRKGSGDRRSRRSALSPSAGFGLDGPEGPSASSPTSQVRTVTGCGCICSTSRR